MASWEDMRDNTDNSYWEHQRERAREAMEDKETGILGQVEAFKEYDKISKRLNDIRR